MEDSIEYHGTAGVTQYSLEAVQALFMSDLRITGAWMLTDDYRHSFIFRIADHHLIAVKSGFSSGYGGEGPSGLSASLHLIEQFEVPGAIVSVDPTVFKRLDSNRLTDDDIEAITAHPVLEGGLPYSLWPFGKDSKATSPAPPWYRAKHVLPVSIFDERLNDLVPKFWRDPDGIVLKAFRRLEHTVRERTGIDEIGQRLMSAAFQKENAPLFWPDVSPGESAARGLLFAGAFGAYRNPAAHNERRRHEARYISEFIVVNELFLLEAQAVERASIQRAAI